MIHFSFLLKGILIGFAIAAPVGPIGVLYLRRTLARFHEAPTKLDAEVDLKDEDILTGDYIFVTTNVLQAVDGSPLTNWPFQVVRREKVSASKIKLKLQKMPARKLAFISPAGTPEYTAATLAQKQYGFISDSQERMSNGDDGYRIY